MRHMLALLFLLAFGFSAFAADIENIVIRDGERSYIDGDSRFTREKQQYGENFAAFDFDGVRYVITDDALLDELHELVEPIGELGAKQGELGAKQGALGAKQGRLGAEQGRLAVRAIYASADDARAMAAEQRRLGERQRELGERQRELGERQRVLGEQMRKLTAEIREEMERTLTKAVRIGVARRVR